MAAGCDWFFENILGKPYKASSGALGMVRGKSLGAMSNRAGLMGVAGLGVGGLAGAGYMRHRRKGY